MRIPQECIECVFGFIHTTTFPSKLGISSKSTVVQSKLTDFVSLLFVSTCAIHLKTGIVLLLTNGPINQWSH